MKKVCFVFVILIFSLRTIAQESSDKVKGCGCRFQSINQVGLMQGEHDGALLVQSINGVKFKQWFTGIGLGVDNYRYRGLPLFADVRRYFFNKQKTPFVFANGGVHLNWLNDHQKTPNWFGGKSEFNNGIYTDFGVGYSLGFKNNTAVVFSAGYSYKNITEKRTFSFECLVPPCPVNIETYKYGLNRLSFKMGVQF